MTTSWGPLPALMTRLARSRPRQWARALDRPGGAWSVLAAPAIRELWPSAFPPRVVRRRAAHKQPPLMPDPGFFDDLADRIGELIERVRQRQPPRTPPTAGEDDGLLRACHAWLGQRNLARVAPWFAPFWHDPPAALAAVSDQGLLWCAAACHLDRWGPVSFTRCRLPLVPDDRMQVLAGDCVALHLAIEDLVASLPKRLGLTVSPHTTRRGGGLRTMTVLTVLPALAAVPEGTAAALWRDAIHALMTCSPLTRMVYLDLCTFDDGRERDDDVPPAVLAPVFHYAATATRARGDRAGRERERHQWEDIWRTHVSRSLLGALLSGPPNLEGLLAARRMLDETKAERDRQARRPIGRRTLARLNDDVARAEEVVRAHEEAVTRAYRPRLPLLSSALAAETGFHRRFVDMAVREVTRECADAMVRTWEGFSADRRQIVEAPRHFFYGPDALCYARFVQMVCGDEGLFVPTAAENASTEVTATVNGAVARLHASIGRLRPEEAAPSTVAEMSVRLPVQVPKGDVPSKIWRAWVMHLQDRLPSQLGTTQVSYEEVAGGAA